MAVKKHGLGKGLEALIPQVEEDTKEELTRVIDINLIRSNDKQPRKYFDEEKIVNLSQSIKNHGIIQPILLKKEGSFYSIIAGERRWRAAKLIGLKEIPSIVMDLTSKKILEISLIENIQREDLNPIEEAIAYSNLITEFNITQESLSERLGKSRTAITNCMRLLNLDKRVQEYIIEGIISEGHGRALLSAKDNDLQYELAQKIIDEGLSVRQIEALLRNIDSISNKKAEKNEAEEFEPYTKEIKNKLEVFFGTKVDVKHNSKNKGKIEIQYYSQDDLNRILELLKLEF